MNLDKMLAYASETKEFMRINDCLAGGKIDDIIAMVKDEMAANVAKQSGRKNVYKAVKKYIEHIRTFYNGQRENLTQLILNVDNGKYYITDGFGLLEFANSSLIDDLPKDIEGNFGKTLFSIVDKVHNTNKFWGGNVNEDDVLLSLKTQKAEHKHDVAYPIHVVLGGCYYDPELLYLLLTMMGKLVYVYLKEGDKNSKLYLSDELGNRAVLMPLDFDVITKKLKEE